MNILIIEDEIKTAKALSQLILSVKPGSKVVGLIQSVKKAVAYFSSEPAPDLIFMDIQLADGLCFEIFKSVKVASPVIFCTAFDDYAIDAFKANGIDYILKPFNRESLQKTFEKVENLTNHFKGSHVDALDWQSILNLAKPQNSKKSFLVFKGNKYLNISTETIAFFYITEEKTYLMTQDQQSYSILQSLEELQNVLSPAQFFRLNRQYLINFSAVKEAEHYFARKLFVRMVVPTPDKLLVSKEKVTAFLSWLEDR